MTQRRRQRPTRADGPPRTKDREPGTLTDGAIEGRVWGTYMHGPVLARNPAFADHLLSLVTGALPPLDDRESEALRSERLLAARSQALPAVTAPTPRSGFR